jgi:hypothetical protein
MAKKIVHLAAEDCIRFKLRDIESVTEEWIDDHERGRVCVHTFRTGLRSEEWTEGFHTRFRWIP